MNKIALYWNFRVYDWTAELAIIASNKHNIDSVDVTDIFANFVFQSGRDYQFSYV